MCGNNDIVISTGGGCGSSSETIKISRNISSCGGSGYTITKTSGDGCGSSTQSYQVNDELGQTLIDEISRRRFLDMF